MKGQIDNVHKYIHKPACIYLYYHTGAERTKLIFIGVSSVTGASRGDTQDLIICVFPITIPAVALEKIITNYIASITFYLLFFHCKSV